MSSAATRVSELFIEFVAASLAFVGLFGHQIRTHRASKFSLDLWPDVLKTFLEYQWGRPLSRTVTRTDAANVIRK